MYYYDSNVFGAAYNPSARSHSHSRRITAPESIDWDLCLCVELISVETTYGALVAEFVVQMALQGKNALVLNTSDLPAVKKANRQLSRRLRVIGLSQKDIQHAMAALIVPSSYLVSDDDDFWDPGLKAGKAGRRIADELLASGLVVTRPENVP